MSDLPDWDELHRATLTQAEIKEIVEAWRLGRLVDREAIDYEAAETAIDLWLMKRHGFVLREGESHEIWLGVLAALDLEDGDG